MPVWRTRRSKQEFLNFIEPAALPKDLDTPGFEGPRPTLSLVLKTLSGNNPELIHLHLDMANPPTLADREALGAALADPKAIEAAESGMSVTMRELADLWIDSGKKPSDPRVDSPANRNAEDIPAGRPTSLFERIELGLLRNTHAQTRMRRNGTWEPVLSVPVFDCDDLDEYGSIEAFERFGQRVAMYWFAALLNLPYSRLIARCDNCGSYFERLRARGVNQGVFCLGCKGKGSVKRTSNTRKSRHNEMLNWAAECWPKWEERHGKRSKWIAEQVNEQIKPQPVGWKTITGRWVTEHGKEIQAEVERRKHATRKN